MFLGFPLFHPISLLAIPVIIWLITFFLSRSRGEAALHVGAVIMATLLTWVSILSITFPTKTLLQAFLSESAAYLNYSIYLTLFIEIVVSAILLPSWGHISRRVFIVFEVVVIGWLAFLLIGAMLGILM